jgi:hypothetical protein
LLSSTKELQSQIAEINRKTDELNKRYTERKQELSNAILQQSNKMDSLEGVMKERRATLRNMADGIQLDVVSLTDARQEESEVKMFAFFINFFFFILNLIFFFFLCRALANLFQRVIVARCLLAGTLTCPYIVQAANSLPTISQVAGASAAPSPLTIYLSSGKLYFVFFFIKSPDDNGFFIAASVTPVSITNPPPSLDGSSMATNLQKQQQVQMQQLQQQYEADKVIRMMKEGNNTNDIYEAQLCLVRDFLLDLREVDRMLIAEANSSSIIHCMCSIFIVIHF